MSPILQSNDLPIREIKICVGCWTWGGHTDTWCNNVDPYTECSYIDTPKTHIASTYALLRDVQETILKHSDLDFSELSTLFVKAKEIRKIISDFESY